MDNSEQDVRSDLKQRGYKSEFLKYHILWYLFILVGSFILPIVGPIFLFYLALRNLFKKHTKFYYKDKKQLYVPDKRFKTGQRPQGYKLVKKYADEVVKPLINERIVFVIKGLVGVSIMFYVSSFQYSIYQHWNDPIPEAKVGVVTTKKGLNMRESASETAKVILSIPYDERVIIIPSKDLTEINESDSSNWLKVTYKNQEGWVWGAYLEQD